MYRHKKSSIHVTFILCTFCLVMFSGDNNNIISTVEATQNRTTFEIVVMAPFEGAKQVGREVIRAARLALDNTTRAIADLPNVHAKGYEFNISVIDTKCSTAVGLSQVVSEVTRLSEQGKAVDAFVGPMCDNVCETVGHLATHWDIPMISFGCEESKLSDRDVYPTFLRTTGTFKSMVIFLEDVLRHFTWDRIMLVSAGSQVWLETEEEFKHELQADGFTVFVWNILGDDWASISDTFEEKSKLSKVFILCMFGTNVLRFLDSANTSDMMDGTHAFISFDYANMGKRTLHPLQGNHITGLLDITVDVKPESGIFEEFIHDIVENSTGKGYSTTDGCSHYEYGIHAGLLYDAVKLYILAVEATLSDGGDPRNGQEIAAHIYDVTLDGITGRFHINNGGSRDSLFMLHNVNGGCYRPLLRSKSVGRGLEAASNHSPIWPGGFLVTPLGYPPCGWDGSLCQGDDVAVVAGVAVSLFVVSVAIAIAIFMYLRMMRRRHDNSRMWIIAADDLKLKDTMTKSRNLNGSGLMNGSLSKFSSAQSVSTDSGTQVFARQYVYQGEDVAGKEVHVDLRKITQGINQMSKEINMITGLTHPNLCHFYGVCITPGLQNSVWEYCRKGSLLDVLHNYQNYLEDIPFKVSFMNDITKGLKYLHHSKRGYHGNLKSANVLVDNKWTCKLAHMMVTCLEGPQDTIDAGDKTNYGRLLSCAPEVLRDPSTAIESRVADVYSFGIVLMEIFTGKEISESFSAAYVSEQSYAIAHRKSRRRHRVGPEPMSFSDPYFSSDVADPKDIVSRLSTRGPIPFRPQIPDAIDSTIRTVLMECWREQPSERPSMESLAGLIRRVSQKYSLKSKSLVEMMLDKVTREADMQAQELKEEKSKSDNLLYQMLPPIVADCLKRQIEVKAETFQSASVYFSDIQGFTELSSVSEPIQIVSFLNDTYYRFDTIIEQYGVYKVETIGDAYVVCSGVPVRVTHHARELSKMALHILMETQSLQVLHRPEQTLQMRIGMHSGPVAAGVVGRTMPRYCLFGDTVNTASRMESTGIAGRIQISEQCRLLLDDSFLVEEREPVYVKGKGTLQTFFLLEKIGFNPVQGGPPSTGVKIDVTHPSPSPCSLFKVSETATSPSGVCCD